MFGGSFYKNICPDEVGCDQEVNTLMSPVSSTDEAEYAGGEAWVVSWSPDGTLFAWSCGHRIVNIVPWRRIKYRQPIFHAEDVPSRRKEAPYVKLCRDRNALPDQLGRRSRKSSSTWETVTIDAGYVVWSMAFGSSTAKSHPGSINQNIKSLRQAEDLILATGMSNGRIRIWDVSTGALLWELMDHKDVVCGTKFSPDGSLQLASASRDGTVKLWDMNDDGNMYLTLRDLNHVKDPVLSCSWSPQGTLLATVGNHRHAVIWNTKTKKMHVRLDGHAHDVVDCDFSPDGGLIATASSDTTVIIWDPYTGVKFREFNHLFPPPQSVLAGGSNGAYVRNVSFSFDGAHVASICEDGYVRYWHLYKDESVPDRVSAGHHDALCCAYSPNGHVLAIGYRNGSVSFYNAPMNVESLQNKCRVTIRRLITPKDVDFLSIPIRHKEFLKYNRDM